MWIRLFHGHMANIVDHVHSKDVKEFDCEQVNHYKCIDNIVEANKRNRLLCDID